MPGGGTSRSPAPGDVWWVDLPLFKCRISVVLALWPVGDVTMYEVAVGRGAPDLSGDHVLVGVNSPAGRLWGLRKDTHFWASNVGLVGAPQFQTYVGRCPGGVSLQLEKLASACSLREMRPR